MFTEKEIKAMAKDLIRNITKERKARKRYFISNKFKLDIKKLKKYLQQNKSIDSEDILYFPEKFPFSESFFCEIVDTLFQEIPTKSDPSIEWANEKLECDGMIFSIICGQGSIYIAKIK